LKFISSMQSDGRARERESEVEFNEVKLHRNMLIND